MQSNFTVAEHNARFTKQQTVRGIMIHVILALVPACISAIVVYGAKAVDLLFVSITSCVLFEFLFNQLMKKKQTILDLSCIVTGIILFLLMPIEAPSWIFVLGALFAIILFKMLFGGIGKNIINPAVGAKALLMVLFGGILLSNIGYISGLRQEFSGTVKIVELLLGYTGGLIGEVSLISIILGGVYLLLTKVIDFKLPFITLISFGIFCLIFTGFNFNQTLMLMLSGGVIFASFFFVTDYSTNPNTNGADWIFAMGIALITAIVRCAFGFTEAIYFAIVIMNVLTPFIDKLILHLQTRKIN